MVHMSNLDGSLVFLNEPPMGKLEEVVRSIEAQVGDEGWDSAPKLFALVDTVELLRQEPELAKELGPAEPGSITAVDQGELPDGDIGETLASILWPESVLGCALQMVRIVLPPEVENEIPTGGDAVAWAAAHPKHDEVRIVVGALRDGNQHAVLRIRRHPDELLSAPDLVPDLAEALSGTLLPDEP
jgi:hypothetical protein